MGAISLEKSQNMYWLGRYMERVFTTMEAYLNFYDKNLDGKNVSHTELCEKLGIPDVYESNEDFLQKYLYDEENSSSITSSLRFAFDNAIVLRDEISSETLSFIHLAMYELEKSKISDERLLDLQAVTDYIYAFWGCLDDKADSELCRNIVKSGRNQERMDLYIRLGRRFSSIQKTFNRLVSRIQKLHMPINQEPMDRMKELMASEALLMENKQEFLNCLMTLIDA